MSKTYLVTGAAGGVGGALVVQLLAKGNRVFAAARRPAAMADLEQAGAILVAMDVAETASVANAYDRIDEQLQGIALDGVIHCAAVAPLGTIEFTTPEDFSAVLNTNTIGALRVVQGALPRLRKASDGRLLLISSLWGRMAGPLASNYSVSKYAVEAIADATRREMGKSTVKITVLEPGVIATAMFRDQIVAIERCIADLAPEENRLYASTYKDYAGLLRRAEPIAISAEKCAHEIVRCLERRRPKPRYCIGLDAKIAVSVARVLPDAVIDRLFAMTFRRSSPQQPRPNVSSERAQLVLESGSPVIKL